VCPIRSRYSTEAGTKKHRIELAGAGLYSCLSESCVLTSDVENQRTQSSFQGIIWSRPKHLTVQDLRPRLSSVFLGSSEKFHAKSCTSLRSEHNIPWHWPMSKVTRAWARDSPCHPIHEAVMSDFPDAHRITKRRIFSCRTPPCKHCPEQKLTG
jgi:hypothetical protein